MIGRVAQVSFELLSFVLVVVNVVVVFKFYI